MSYGRSSRYLKVKLQEIDGEFGFKAVDGRYGMSDNTYFGASDCLPYLAQILIDQNLEKRLSVEIRKKKSLKKKRNRKVIEKSSSPQE